MTGSIAQRYPIDSYGIDNQVGFSITHLERSFLGALQSVAGLVWMALVFCVRGVLMLLEWGFSIDLLGEAMAGVRGTLVSLHEGVIGRPWFLAALSIAGLWGIWRGLVQRQATQTIAGLSMTVLLMVCGLVVLARPNETVGYASRLANDASLGILSAATGQDPDRPMRSLAAASAGVFDVMVRDPWCALEFGSVDYCHKHPPGHPQLTNADVWLRYSAGSDERRALYLLLQGRDPDDRGGLLGRAKDLVGLGGDKPANLPDKVKKLVAADPDRATMQDAGGTFTRFALLGLIAAGVSGACVLLAYLGVRLLLAAVLALLLLLFAPAMLLAPCFGEAGRATFIAWAKRLIGALAAKLIYALFLAVVLAAAATLRQLDIGWFGVWLLQIAFWWGVFLKRHELIGFVAVKHQSARESGGGGLARQLAHGYYAMQVGRVATRHAGRLLAAPRRARAEVALRRDQATQTRETATGELAAERLDQDARDVLEADYHRARGTLEQRDASQRELRAIDRRLTGFDEAHAASRATAGPAPAPNEEQTALLRRRRELLEQLATPAATAAGQRVAHGDRNRAQTGGVVSSRDLDAYRHQRAADHAADLPVTHERHLRAAGIDPDALATAAPADRAAMTRHVEAHLERERDLLAALPDLTPDGRTDPRRAELHIDPQAVRSRLAAKHAHVRRERHRQRARQRAKGR